MNIGVSKIAIGIAGGFLLLAASAWAQDDPNIVRENGRTYYIVQRGDTLWDISRKFLNSPDYWPELWQANRDAPITNPHRIYPGQRIRLFRHGETPGEAMARAPEPMPPTPSFRPPAPAPPRAAPTPSVSELDAGRIAGTFRFSAMERIGFIREYPEPPHAVVMRSTDRKEMISFGDRVYLRETGHTPLAIGKYYITYRTVGPILDRKTGEPVGTQHIPTGVLEIREQTPDYTIATVLRAYRDIRIDDRVMPFRERSPELNLAPGIADMDGTIVTSEERNNIYGEHDVVFINRGENHGIGPGQEYIVFIEEFEPVVPGSRERIVISPVDIGRLVVLHAEPTTATALITQSSRTIRPGAMLRTAR